MHLITDMCWCTSLKMDKVMIHYCAFSLNKGSVKVFFFMLLSFVLPEDHITLSNDILPA